MKKVISTVVIVSLCCFFSCSKKADTVLILDGDNVAIKGKVTMEMGLDGNFRPKLWVPGNIVVCRTDGEARGQSYKAGFAYRMNDNLELEEICSVDMSLSNDQLWKTFLNKTE